MKRAILAILALALLAPAATFASGNPFPKISLTSPKNDHSQSLKEKDYAKAMQKEKMRTGGKYSLFYIDFRLGYGSTNPNYDVNSGVSGVDSKSKGGFTGGAFLTFTLFDMVNFTTGLDFTKKNFGFTSPIDSATLSSATTDISNSYLNIPITFNFGGQISEKIGLGISLGPYFGFLMGGDNNIEDFGLKNFDFGVDATLTGDYALNQFVGIILGTGAQFGGLNNLGSTPKISDVKTTNWKFFTGLRVGL